jgi:hypothetical protein
MGQGWTRMHIGWQLGIPRFSSIRGAGRSLGWAFRQRLTIASTGLVIHELAEVVNRPPGWTVSGGYDGHSGHGGCGGHGGDQQAWERPHLAKHRPAANSAASDYAATSDVSSAPVRVASVFEFCGASAGSSLGGGRPSSA